MRIIVANRYFSPDQSATSRMVSSLAFALAEAGFDVTVLASRHYHDGAASALAAEEVINGVRVCRLATTRFGRGRLAGRAIDYLCYHLAASGWLMRNARSGDICIICTDPPLLSVSAALPLRLRGARLVNWLMDLFPEVAIDLDLVGRQSLVARLALALRDGSLRRAALNICPTQTMEAYLRTRAIAPRQLTTITNWSEGSALHPVPRQENSLRREWGIGDELVVGYSGNFGRAHDFSTILEAAEHLREVAGIRFLLIGDGRQKGQVQAEIARRGLHNVMLKPLQPVERLAESLSVPDVHLVSLLPALERSVIPSKLYGILAVGRPTLFIGDAQGEVGSTIARAGCGLSVAIGEGRRLAAIIGELDDRPDEIERMGTNARALFDASYTRETGVAAWQANLRTIISATRAIDGEISQGVVKP